jgi:deoxyhypusine synthase
MLFFHSYKNPGLVLDIIQDIRAMNDHAMKAAPRKTGAIILGGGAGWAPFPGTRQLCSTCQEQAGFRCRVYHDILDPGPCVTGGAGVPKHHICNANLMKNGADFAVFVNTAQEFDGSDSGARLPQRACRWCL